ncbi:MAG: Ig-like domain-containing protein, partial [Bacteroidetes bacterium]|nr:Ig-like domain-containing protein [Bacteroidota bacterium]
MQGIARYGIFVSIVISWSQILISCIGTDILEVVTVEPELRITTPFSSIKVGDEVQFEAVYFNDLGNVEEADILWSSSDNNIITIDNQGLAMALNPGNVLISASYLELI